MAYFSLSVRLSVAYVITMLPSMVILPYLAFETNAVSDVVRSGLGLPFTVVLSLFTATSSAKAISNHDVGFQPNVADV